MNYLDNAGANGRAAAASHAVALNGGATHLSGRWLQVARVIWLALALTSVGLYALGVPGYYEQVYAGCDASVCDTPPVDLIARLGLSTSWRAGVWTVFYTLIQAIWYAVGFLLFWRRSDDWMALLAALFLVTVNAPLTLPLASLALPVSLINFVGSTAALIFFLLFPNGRLVPRWTGLLLVAVIVYGVWDNFLSRWEPYASLWPDWLYWLFVLVSMLLFGAIIAAQIYRYRHVSTPLQRQQTKWVVVGITAALGTFITFQALSVFVLGLTSLSIGIITLDHLWLFGQAWSFLIPLALVLVPVSIGFSILRYRLYDIDRIINRTLVYGALTASLALVYVTLTIALQSLARLVSGAASEAPLVIVASTLAIAALFLPLRNRLQVSIDRRFYRRKYDATQTVAAFSATLRQEVEVGQLRERLLGVVQETMQPSSVSLWLRQPEPGEEEHPHAAL